LLVGITTRATSAITWGRISTTSTNRRNPWQIYDVYTLQHDELHSSESIFLLQQQQLHVVSIRGGSSATGEYFLYLELLSLLFVVAGKLDDFDLLCNETLTFNQTLTFLRRQFVVTYSISKKRNQ
jgi:hypothetical protein